MGVIIGATDALTGDYYSTWGKLRSPILGQAEFPTPYIPFEHTVEYPAGEGFLTDNDTPLRFDMRYDSTTWPPGYWRPEFSFYPVTDPAYTYGWYGRLVGNAIGDSQTITNEDRDELIGEVVVASGSLGTFTMNADFFGSYPGQLLDPVVLGTVTKPIFSVGKLNAF